MKLISWWEMKEVGPESQVRSREPTLLQSLVQGMGTRIFKLNPYCKATGASALGHYRNWTEAVWDSESQFTFHLRPGTQPVFKAHLLNKCV